MQIVAARIRGPLITDERGEAPRVVVLFRRRDGLVPGAAVSRCAGYGHDGFGNCAFAEVGDDIDRRRRALTGKDHLVPFAPLRISHDAGIATEEHREEAKAIRVIRHHQEIERARELDRLPAGRHDFLAARQAVGLFRSQSRAERTGIHRVRGMQVGIAEVWPRRVIAPDIGRVSRFAGVRPFRRGLVGSRKAGRTERFGGQRRKRQARQDQSGATDTLNNASLHGPSPLFQNAAMR